MPTWIFDTMWFSSNTKRRRRTIPPPLQPSILICYCSASAGTAAAPIGNQQNEQDKDDQEHNSPAGISPKGASIVHADFPLFINSRLHRQRRIRRQHNLVRAGRTTRR